MRDYDSISDLSFVQMWSPVMIGILLFIGAIYIWSVHSYEKRHTVKLEKKGMKLFFFLAGLLAFYIAEGSPVKAIGHHFFFSVHMFSMSVIYFVFPPLLLAGLYEWMVIPVIRVTPVKFVLKILLKPLLAVSLFNLFLSFYHIPIFFDAIMSDMTYMILANIFLIFLAFIMWWVIIPPTDELGTIDNPKKLIYVFFASVLLTPACAMITFAPGMLYESVATEPVIWIMSRLEDQHTGGVVMKVMQEIVFIATFGYIFFKWFRQERETNKSNDLNPSTDALRPQLK
ncbi:cytochrome c oxidase assembly protein [Tuberibacillus sp. Marseille-P3662]|uniref:cytochrome c oxidase assembly protein n=1 Tax=Tuberibacillus sp. Marseille-P3662 TaxID=1965358 RepID=UPI000A1CE4DA|nr:cytochrome c oxidase assembly protein [Tuberibacillus sp. Marseille-P3662]